MTASVLFVFLDGVGLGPDDPGRNPLALLRLPLFERLAGGRRWTLTSPPVNTRRHVFHPIDATLGVPGLPQSGTGQAALLTGINAPMQAGRHYGPFPHSANRAAIAEHNLFRRVTALRPEAAAFANAYPPRFFTYVERTLRWTVTTRCCLDAGVRIRNMDDLRAGEALSADITGEGLVRLGVDAPVVSEGEAGRLLVRLARRHAVTLFEYYLTDKAGHSTSARKAQEALESLDRFFAGVLDALDPERMLLVVASDHGNIEDLGTKSHTLNPVPLIAYGANADLFASVRDLMGVTPAVVEAVRQN